jgi:5-formyltetrahydrofolate cyclo-ligase
VVVPGLAFDRAGHRLGYGKGFYDRFLAQLNPKVIKVGLVPSQLIFEQLPKDPWDQPVDYLVSELGVWSPHPDAKV